MASAGIGWQQFKHGSFFFFFSVGAPVQQRRLLGEVAIYFPSFISSKKKYFLFLIPLFPPLCLRIIPCTNISLLATLRDRR